MANTQHTHQMAFGRKVDGCPRCEELKLGAPARQWKGYRSQEIQAERIRAIREHDCKRCGCGPVCTAFEW